MAMHYDDCLGANVARRSKADLHTESVGGRITRPRSAPTRRISDLLSNSNLDAGNTSHVSIGRRSPRSGRRSPRKLEAQWLARDHIKEKTISPITNERRNAALQRAALNHLAKSLVIKTPQLPEKTVAASEDTGVVIAQFPAPSSYKIIKLSEAPPRPPTSWLHKDPPRIKIKTETPNRSPPKKSRTDTSPSREFVEHLIRRPTWNYDGEAGQKLASAMSFEKKRRKMMGIDERIRQLQRSREETHSVYPTSPWVPSGSPLKQKAKSGRYLGDAGLFPDPVRLAAKRFSRWKRDQQIISFSDQEAPPSSDRSSRKNPIIWTKEFQPVKRRDLSAFEHSPFAQLVPRPPPPRSVLTPASSSDAPSGQHKHVHRKVYSNQQGESEVFIERAISIAASYRGGVRPSRPSSARSGDLHEKIVPSSVRPLISIVKQLERLECVAGDGLVAHLRDLSQSQNRSLLQPQMNQITI